MPTVTSTRGSDTPLKAWARALSLTAPIAHNPGMTLSTRIAELADTFEGSLALIGEDEALTYRALAERANRYARWALGQGLGRGDVVCLMMHNCPDYLAAWLGITRVGAVVALINTNLIGDSLAHAIRVATASQIIVGADLAATVAAVSDKMPGQLSCWVRGGHVDGMACLDAALERLPAAVLTAAECTPPSLRDRALYIYTSGTTGLPKAAKVSHHRVLQWSYWFAGLLDVDGMDRMYNCLPMYHSVGGIVAIGSILVRGGSVVLRRKFSARNFWNDITQTQCTLFQYIGELCRFLVNMPNHPRERDHQIRIACGNGLRPDIWESFQSRFAIPNILEFYAATEANFSLYNCEGKPGAIGRIPPFLAHRFPIALVALDHGTGEALRDEQGRCRRCAVDEIGEAIGRIATDGSPEGQFDGYTDRAASDRKVLRNVFSEGDAWFRSGDLMRRDAAGFFHFVDRIGDTFRWKGENVSTGEVADAACAWPEVREAVVYGVDVPGNDGRAGMIAIVTDSGGVGGLDLAGFRSHLSARLPEYARPMFVRLLSEIETTGTFKPMKQELVRTGFDPNATTDALFVNDRESGAFIPLDAALFECIRAGRFRL
ncbi:MAG TPA: long-chain-acyl-CoA synthetase [Gemmatimonadaceae bacterium]|nr:long-chain-acyl-CoA synthetase [Gemmatimonadaceae bacterium]